MNYKGIRLLYNFANLSRRFYTEEIKDDVVLKRMFMVYLKNSEKIILKYSGASNFITKHLYKIIAYKTLLSVKRMMEKSRESCKHKNHEPMTEGQAKSMINILQQIREDIK